MVDLKEIFILAESKDSDLALRVERIFGRERVIHCDVDPFLNFRGQMSPSEYSASKKRLVIKRFKGNFFKRCPGASQKKALTCCNYYVLNLGQQCNMNCTYCYLQSYLNYPALVLYSNFESAIAELEELKSSAQNQMIRIGTGEVMDSLSMDAISGYSEKLIAYFSSVPNWTLELKTKSSEVRHLPSVKGVQNVQVGFSINCEYIVNTEELGTANLMERFAAARQLLEKGYRVCFHLDPILIFEGWKKEYGDLIECLATHFLPSEIDLISLGTLRIKKEQLITMRQRVPSASAVFRSELMPSENGKLRYDQHLRSFALKWIQENLSRRGFGQSYLCMETPESWISSYGELPTKIERLRESFRPIAFGDAQ